MTNKPKIKLTFTDVTPPKHPMAKHFTDPGALKIALAKQGPENDLPDEMDMDQLKIDYDQALAGASESANGDMKC